MDHWELLNNGSLKINEKPFIVKAIQIQRLIGTGANGIVLECFNEILNRKEAMKIWLKLRPKDTRDKRIQGQLEAIKAASAVGPTPAVYSAGIQNGYFYTTMEYVPGVTLKRHLKDNPLTLLEKRKIAEKYIDLMSSFSSLIHGDPHSGNVMIGENRGMVLLDFGTSVLMGNSTCESRHWRIVENVFSTIMAPFEFNKIMATSYREPPREIEAYFNFLFDFFDMLWFIGLRPKGFGMSIFYEQQKRDLSGINNNMRKALNEIKNTNAEYLSNESNLGFPWFY